MAIKLTEEAMNVAKKLSSEWFMPTSQANEDDPAAFLIHPMTQDEYLEFNSNCKSEVQESSDLEEGQVRVSLQPTATAHRIVFAKVMNWRNVTDEAGADIEFTAKQFRQLIPWQDQYEVMERIISRSNLTEEEKKTS